MQTHHQAHDAVVGLRPVTPGLLRAEAAARSWTGLPEGMTKGGLLQLIEDVPARIFGGDGAKRHLHYCVKRHPSSNFKSARSLKGRDLAKEGLALISTWSDAELSADLGVTVRTLQRWREDAVDTGWLCFVDSPERARFWIGPIDAPTEAYGLDLRPLIARISEMVRFRDTAKAEQKELKTLRRILSARANRIRSAIPLLPEALTPPDATSALKAIESVRRGRDVQFANMALALADQAIASLDALITERAAAFSTASPTSGARDKTGAKLLPTPLPTHEFNSLEVSREAQQEGASPTLLAPAHVADDEDDEEIVWQSADYDADECEGPVIEVCVPVKRPVVAATTRINLPTDSEVLADLPAILATKGWSFARHPSIPTDRALLLAYGISSAERCGLEWGEIKFQSKDNEKAFAIAAFLAEFTHGVLNRKAYLLGLALRIQDPKIKVNLWASWKRLVRETVNRPVEAN